MKNNVLIGVQRAIITDKDSKVLIVRNIGKEFWHYPGGKWEPDQESIIDGLRREISEELGLSDLHYSFLAIQELRRDSRTYLETYWLAVSAFAATDIHLRVQNEEIEAIKWVSIDELEKYGVLPGGVTPLLSTTDCNDHFLGTF